MNKLKILVTGDNCCLAHDFIGHSGQSLLIQYNNNNYLFDTGEFEFALTNNLFQFGIEYDQIKDIIISHAHFDHTVGFLNVIEKLQSQRIIIPEQLFYEKLLEKQLQRYNVKLDLTKYLNYPNKVVVNDYLEIESGLFVTGPIASEKLLEQSVVIDLKEKGLVVLVGCTHPGIKKIVDRAIEITGNTKIYGIMGGLHFIDDNAEQLTANIDYLASLNLSFIIPMHCTGLSAMNELVKRFGKDKVVMSQSGSIGAGNSIEIEPELNLNFERRF